MRKKLTLWLISVGLISLFASALQAQHQQIKMTRLGPTVEIRDPASMDLLREGADGELVTESDLLMTVGAGSRVILVFSNGATINIGAESEVLIRQFTQDPFGEEFSFAEATAEPDAVSSTSIHLTRGELVGSVKTLREGSSFEVTTPAGAAGIRGTTFRVVFRPNGDGTAFFIVTTIEGDVDVSTADGTTTSLISVTDQQEIEVLVEVDDATGEVTVLTPVTNLVATTASPAVIAAAAQEVQAAAEAVVDIVLTEAGGGFGGGGLGGNGDFRATNEKNDPPPQTQTDRLSPTGGG